MLFDMAGALFPAEGVPTALVRGGEPRLRRPKRLEVVAAERVHERPRATPLHRLLRPAAS